MSKVAFDAREVRNPGAPAAGISRYIRGLVPALAREEPRLQVVTFVRRLEDAPPEWAEISNLQVRELPHSPLSRLPLLWPHLVVPRAMGEEPGVGLVHGPANSLPLGRLRVPAVVTLHDLAIYERPEWYPDGQWLSLRRVVPSAVGRAGLLLCVSQRTAREVGRLFPNSAGRTRVVPNGLEARFHLGPAQEDLAVTRAALDLPQRYVLAVGTVEPRKGYDVLIQAFARVLETEPDAHLLIAGGPGWKCDEVLAMPARMGLEHRVRFLGYVEDARLPALMALATAFTSPSLDEGFGFPPLEAMAAGVPVVASSAGAIPEVTGDAALLVRPGDSTALAGALRRILEDDQLRQKLSGEGRLRARMFTWEETARGTLRVYREAGLRL